MSNRSQARVKMLQNMREHGIDTTETELIVAANERFETEHFRSSATGSRTRPSAKYLYRVVRYTSKRSWPFHIFAICALATCTFIFLGQMRHYHRYDPFKYDWVAYASLGLAVAASLFPAIQDLKWPPRFARRDQKTL